MTRPIIFIVILFLSLHIQAVHLSKDGTGQVLIFPYYTVNGGHNTLITLVNLTNEAKALRVRFREAANSREVFAFNVYLGANDEWTGGVINDGRDSEMPHILSFDQSCTVPNISLSSNTKFYDNNLSGEFSDPYSDFPYRMNEGFVEVIEMGVMTGASAEAVTIEDNVANDCSKIENAWNSDGYWSENAEIDMLPPTGGITGNITIIHVEKGVASTQKPTVFENFSNEILNFNTNNDSPSLADSSVNAQIENEGVLIDTYWPTGYQAISALLMKNSISNEFVTTDSIGADTDWILTMPTRQYHIDPRYAQSTTPVAPFVDDNYSCEEYGVDYWDRESQVPADAIDPPLPPLPPPPYVPPPKGLCFSANNIVFINHDYEINPPYGIFSSHLAPDNGGFDETSILIETLASEEPSYFDTGWTNLTFAQSVEHVENNQRITLYGLPVIGFAAQRYINTAWQSNRNYAGIFSHKYSKDIFDNEISEEAPMHISSDNKGQVLLFPYYTVKNGLNTLISVINTTDEVKALKVRFSEGKNSRNAFDFNLYIAPYDVWTAGLVPHQSTIAGHIEEPSTLFISIDNSCTTISQDEQASFIRREFIPDAFTGEFEDGLGESMTRVQEGSIEIFEMGTLGSAADISSAIHNNSGEPSCSRLFDNWTEPNGKWVQDPNEGLIAPDGSGGLYGSVSLIDVARGVDITYDATAIKNFTTEVNHTHVSNLAPNLSTGSINKTLITTDEGVVNTTWESPLNAVTALFMQFEVSNDYVIDSSMLAKTDWVNFYPTKPFYSDPLFSGSKVNLAPFPQLDNQFNQYYNEDCTPFIFIAHNRDQKTSIFGPIPPGIFPPSQDCWGVNIASVNEQDEDLSLFGSSLQTFGGFTYYHSIYEIQFNSGWMHNTYNSNLNSLIGMGDNGETHEIFGLPVLGFAAQRYINNNSSPGVIANYAAVQENKTKRKIVITPSQ